MTTVTIADARAHLEKAGYATLDERPRMRPGPAAEAIRAAGLTVRPLEVDMAAFESFVGEVDYRKNYPDYCEHFSRRDEATLKRKFFEQYLSATAVAPRADGVYADIAAAGCPWADIVRRLHGAKAYVQDLRFRTGVHGDRIGSNAAEIPLPDASLDGIVSLNAIEHFEGDSDFGFLKEAARLLKPGGVICVAPHVPTMEGFSVTSPSKWSSRSDIDTDWPTFDPRLPVVIEERARQRCLKVPSADSYIEDMRRIPEVDWSLVVLQGLGDFRFQRSMLVGVKQP